MDYPLFITKHKYKIAFFVFVGYLCLSLYKIGHNSLWYDECFSIDWANDPISDIIDFSLKDINPPLYLIILHYWMEIFGESETALRSLSAVGASAGCAVLFLYSLRFFNWQTAIFVTLLFFTSNEIFYYSQEGRTYGLVLLFTVLSNYAFLSFVKSPNYTNVLLLGIFNACIFYLHTLASFVFIGQVLLVPFLTFERSLLSKQSDNIKSFLGFRVKHIVYYLLSWLTFGGLFLPWKDRLIELLTKKQTVVWSSTPSFLDFKLCVYDFHNTQKLFYVLIASSIIILILITFVKKFRGAFDYRLLLIPIILGPFLLFLNYFLAVNITPIFVKRYVLFTTLGFILMYAYIFSILKLDFRIKMGIFLVLVTFLAISMKVPKESTWDFKEGVQYVLKRKNPTSYISTDIPMMYSYYVDRKVIFKSKEGIWRDVQLNKYGIYPSYSLNWQNTTDFAKYSDIYYTSSFGMYSDPEKIVERDLNNKFILTDDTLMKGMFIAHYKIIHKTTIDSAKEDIKNNKEWFPQIIEKAKQRNVTIDSMLTLDAIWMIKNKNKAK